MQSDIRLESLWCTIISELTVSPQDIQTILQDGSGGIWIHAAADGDTIIINRAKKQHPVIAVDVSSRHYPIREQVFAKDKTQLEGFAAIMSAKSSHVTISARRIWDERVYDRENKDIRV